MIEFPWRRRKRVLREQEARRSALSYAEQLQRTPGWDGECLRIVLDGMKETPRTAVTPAVSQWSTAAFKSGVNHSKTTLKQNPLKAVRNRSGRVVSISLDRELIDEQGRFIKWLAVHPVALLKILSDEVTTRRSVTQQFHDAALFQ